MLKPQWNEGTAETYSLLEELSAAGVHYGVPRSARALLAQAILELTDHHRRTPARPIPPHIQDAERAFATIDELLAQQLHSAADLPSTLRLIRVRDLVTEANRTR